MARIIIDVDEECRRGQELYREMIKNSRRLYGVSVYDYIIMKRNQRHLSTLSKRMEEATSKESRQLLKAGISELQKSIASHFLGTHEYKKALSAYEALPKKECGESRINGMARALIGLGEFKTAGRMLAGGLKRYPESVSLLVAKGILHQQSGDSKFAIDYFDEALRLEPKNEYALCEKAAALGALGQKKKALMILKKFFRKYPGDARMPELMEQFGG